MTSASAARGGLLAALAIYASLSLVSWNQIEEDAFIYFRAAANIADGYGYVFNRGGEPVETGSSLLWQLLLVGLHTLPGPIVPVAKWTGIALGAVCLPLTARLTRLVSEDEAWTALPPLLLSVSVPFVMWSQRGLETPLYTALLLWTALWVCEPGRRPFAWIPGALLLLGRPESPILSLVLLAFLPWKGEQRQAGRALAFVLAIAAAGLAARFAYFHDFVSQPFYLKIGLGRHSALDQLWSFAAGGTLVVALPILAAGWRRSFWTRERLLLLAAAVVLTIWASRNVSTMSHSRQLAPALPFFYALAASGSDVLARRIGPLPGALRATALIVLVAAVALTPRVHSTASLRGPNPIHRTLGHFASAPGAWATALGRKLVDPSARTLLDELPVPDALPIEHNWQAQIGRFIALNYPPDAVVVYDQMGQTPYYAGPDTTFIDSFGLTDRTSGFYTFTRRASRNTLLGLYHRTAISLVRRVFPEERREIRQREALDAIFDREPDLILIHGLVVRSAGASAVTGLLERDPRLHRRYFPRLRLAGWVVLWERRDRKFEEPIVPDGLKVIPFRRSRG